MSPPAAREQPRPRLCHFSAAAPRGPPRHALPPLEPATGGRRVDPHRRRLPSSLRPVLPSIQEHVGQRIPYFMRCPKHTHVVPPIDDRSRAPKDPVHGPSESRPDRLHPRSQRLLPRRLHDRVHMVRLHRVVHHAKQTALTCLRERALKGPDEAARPQGRHVSADAHDHMRRTPRLHAGTPHVMNDPLSPSGPTSSTAVPTRSRSSGCSRQ